MYVELALYPATCRLKCVHFHCVCYAKRNVCNSFLNLIDFNEYDSSWLLEAQ